MAYVVHIWLHRRDLRKHSLRCPSRGSLRNCSPNMVATSSTVMVSGITTCIIITSCCDSHFKKKEYISSVRICPVRLYNPMYVFKNRDTSENNIILFFYRLISGMLLQHALHDSGYYPSEEQYPEKDVFHN